MNYPIKEAISLYNEFTGSQMTMKSLACEILPDIGKDTYKATLFSLIWLGKRKAHIVWIAQTLERLSPVPVDFILGKITENQARIILNKQHL